MNQLDMSGVLRRGQNVDTPGVQGGKDLMIGYQDSREARGFNKSLEDHLNNANSTTESVREGHLDTAGSKDEKRDLEAESIDHEPIQEDREVSRENVQDENSSRSELDELTAADDVKSESKAEKGTGEVIGKEAEKGENLSLQDQLSLLDVLVTQQPQTSSEAIADVIESILMVQKQDTSAGLSKQNITRGAQGSQMGQIDGMRHTDVFTGQLMGSNPDSNEHQMGQEGGGNLLAESFNKTVTGEIATESSAKNEVHGISSQPQNGLKPITLNSDDQLKTLDTANIKEGQQAQENKDVNQARLTRVMSNAVQQKGGVVTMRLSPHELGVVRIEMEMSEGVIKAQLSTEKEGARDMLRLQMNDLKQTLESQGFKVEKLEVSTITQSQESSNESGKEMKDDKSKEFDRRHDSAGQQSRGRRDQKPGENHSFQSVEEEMTLAGTEFAEQIDRA